MNPGGDLGRRPGPWPERVGTAPTGPTLALDIGGTKIAAALVAADGAVTGRQTRPTPAAAGGAAVLTAAIELGRQVASGAPLRAVGVGSAGVIDPGEGVVRHATGALPGWTGTRVGPTFAQAFGVPTRVINDVHAHALGEARHGAGRGAASMLLVAVGTGIGGGYVAAGRLHVGARFVAGHVGHLPVPEAVGVPCPCGRSGHLEGLASGPGILAAYRAAGGTAAATVEVARRAHEGEALAQDVLERCALATGRAVGALANVLDPVVVVVGGGVSASGELWWAALRAGVALEAMDAVAAVPLLPAATGADAALLGAAAAAGGLGAVELTSVNAASDGWAGGAG